MDDEAVKNPTRGGTTESIVDLEELANLLNERMKKRQGGNNQRLANILGWRTKDNQNPVARNIPSGNRSQFTLEKYKFFLEAPFDISNRCCNVMKKQPAHDYHRRTLRNPITATMASESKLRTQKWLQNGCNGFDLKIPTSNPMSFWTEQDVLTYIRVRGDEMVRKRAEQSSKYMKYGDRFVSRQTGATIKSKEVDKAICSVYGDIVTEDEKYGQLNLTDVMDMGEFELGIPTLSTTGCQRTGCVLCGFGCHLEKQGQGRFELLKQTHPTFYNLLFVLKNNGYTYAEAIDWINEHGNLNIRY